MSVATGIVSVGTTATQIDGNDINPVTLYIHNLDATRELYIGAADVTTANGYVLNKGQELKIELPAAGVLYLISTDTGHQVSWMKIGHY